MRAIVFSRKKAKRTNFKQGGNFRLFYDSTYAGNQSNSLYFEITVSRLTD